MSEAIILAGGLGTRLRSVVADRPKPMALVAGRPFLAWQFELLPTLGVRRVVLAVGYLGDQIQAYFGRSYPTAKGPVAVEYSVETEPLGTGGAIAQALARCDTQRVLALNGDTYTEVNTAAMAARADQSQAECVVGLTQVTDPARYGLADWHGAGHALRGFRARGDSPGPAPHWINSGAYLIVRQSFLSKGWPQKFSFETDYLAPEATAGRLHAVANGPAFLDIGVPEDYARAQHWLPAQFSSPSVSS